MDTRKQLQFGIYKVINPLVRVLIKAGLTPNMVTTIGLALNIGVACIFIAGAEEGARGDLSYVGWAGALILFAGLFDMLDGQVARLGNMSSRFGALYDSVLDRYSELILFLGICYYLVAHHYFVSSLFAFIGMIGSLMVSYTRARAEGLGIECKDGLMQRPERVVLTGVSALACGIASKWLGGNYKIPFPHSTYPIFETISIFTIPLTILAVLANYTAIGRLRDAKKALEEQDRAREAANSHLSPEISNTSNSVGNSAGNSASNPIGGNPAVRPPGSPVWLIILMTAATIGAAGQNTSASPKPATSSTTSSSSKSTTPGSSSATKPETANGSTSTSAAKTTATSSPSGSGPRAAAPANAADTFPVPPRRSNSLFYLQRTPNTNTIICELNAPNGVPDKEDPVHVLWIRYTEQKQREELNFIQRHFAYGIKSKDLGNDAWELRFVSYKRIPMYLRKSSVDNLHHVFINIDNHQVALDRIFIKINPGGTFWSPNVEYLEFRGRELETGKELMQRVKPNLTNNG